MQKRTMQWLTVLLFLFAGCGKPGFNDLGGTSTFNGVLLLHDTLAGSYAFVPLSNQTILLQNPSDTTAYLYTAKSNNLGQFSFTAFDSLSQYRIYAAIDSNHIHYSGLLSYTGYSAHALNIRDSLILTADEGSQNGIFYKLTDANGGRLNNARFYVYGSELIWMAKDTNSSNFKMSSDPSGRCLVMNVAPNQIYYIQARDSIAPGVVWNGTDTVLVATVGIRKKTLALK